MIPRYQCTYDITLTIYYCLSFIYSFYLMIPHYTTLSFFLLSYRVTEVRPIHECHTRAHTWRLIILALARVKIDAIIAVAVT